MIDYEILGAFCHNHRHCSSMSRSTFLLSSPGSPPTPSPNSSWEFATKSLWILLMKHKTCNFMRNFNNHIIDHRHWLINEVSVLTSTY